MKTIALPVMVLSPPQSDSAGDPSEGTCHGDICGCTGIPTASKSRQGKLTRYEFNDEPEFKGGTMACISNLQHQFINRRSAT